MKNTLHILGLLALAALGTASAGASTGDQTITFEMGKIQVLDVVDPSTPLTMTWSNADWVAGSYYNSKYDPYNSPSLTTNGFAVLPGGTLTYSTNANSKIVVTSTPSPSYVEHTHLEINGMWNDIDWGNGSGEYYVYPGAGTLSLGYGAFVNASALAGNAASVDTKTYTFTLQDQ